MLDGMDCETGQRPRSVEEIFRGLSQKTMKWSSYFPVYQSLVAPFAGKAVTIVEIGVLNGGSLVMWRELLGPDALIRPMKGSGIASLKRLARLTCSSTTAGIPIASRL